MARSEPAARGAPRALWAEFTGSRGFIVGPAYDSVFFIGAPLLALVLGLLLFQQPALLRKIELPALNPMFSQPAVMMAIKVFIQAHLVLVLFRSHLNPKINGLHPVRFAVVPVALLVGGLTSQVFLVFLLVVAVWWDVYHSALQTFGIGRIYDARRGNDLEAGRTADRILNIAVYVGPILAGTSFLSHVRHFELFERVDMQSLARIAEVALAHSGEVRIGVIAVGVPVVVFYLLHYARLVSQGYTISGQKLVLFTSTAACSIYCWGFLAPAKAFFIMNFFHAFQYFAIVWWSEKKNMVSVFGLAEVRFQTFLVLLLLLLPAFTYGLWAVVKPGVTQGVVAVAAVVSILHFWYDGFIWSVRKKQV